MIQKLLTFAKGLPWWAWVLVGLVILYLFNMASGSIYSRKLWNMIHDQIVQEDKAIQEELEKEVTRLDQRERELIQWSPMHRSGYTILTPKWGDIPAKSLPIFLVKPGEKENDLLKQRNAIPEKLTELAKREAEVYRVAFEKERELTDRALKLAEVGKPKSNWEIQRILGWLLLFWDF